MEEKINLAPPPPSYDIKKWKQNFGIDMMHEQSQETWGAQFIFNLGWYANKHATLLVKGLGGEDDSITVAGFDSYALQEGEQK